MGAQRDNSMPALQGEALAAVEHRGSHMQIIASAGSGKTEVVSQRVANLIAEGEDPRSIVAFTFTERAAAELKERISLRVEGLIGAEALGRLGGLFVGTIHAYCFRILQQFTSRYETFDVLDDSRLTAFLVREARHIGLNDLAGGVYAGIRAFRRDLDVVDNEMLGVEGLEDPFRSVLSAFRSSLERYRFLTYGMQIRLAVEQLESDPQLKAAVLEQLRYLVVDEYQDINPAQERLIELLASGDGVELCVVGDDDQAIYQWRGSDVRNIIEFASRYEDVATFELTTNRRSRPAIIQAANAFAQSISSRLSKQMGESRDSGIDPQAIAKWVAEDEQSEAEAIADVIRRFHDECAVAYRDMAILVRSAAAYPKLVGALGAAAIPVQPGGRIGLFDTPDGRLMGRVFCWLASLDWRQGRSGGGAPVALDVLAGELSDAFDLVPQALREARDYLVGWKDRVDDQQRPQNLVRDYYELLRCLRVSEWDIGDPDRASRLGSLARFSSLLVDYENVRRRARPDDQSQGEQVGGEDRGAFYYHGLGTFILNYATGEYEGFDGEPDFDTDAVDLLTVHRAKGLEWPVVFLPSLTASRFPSARTGQRADWLVPRSIFAAERYEGTDNDERRLFYVGLTRARDWLSVSRHARVTTRATGSSPYFEELAAAEEEITNMGLPADVQARPLPETPHVDVTYTELATFLECGMAYRFRARLGFQPEIAQELGYGRAVHHVLRGVAEQARAGAIPQPDDIETLLDTDFFLAFANKPAHKQMKETARRLLHAYVDQYPDDLRRVWQTEYPFELHLDGITVSGRADVILDEQDGHPGSLALLDYKTSTSGDRSSYDLQLQIYADAGRRAGQDVRAAYVHDLKDGVTGATSARREADVSEAAIAAAEATVVEAGEKLRRRDFGARPDPSRCSRCDVRAICAESASPR